MLSQDEKLYTELKKKSLGIESARQMIESGILGVRHPYENPNQIRLL